MARAADMEVARAAHNKKVARAACKEAARAASHESTAPASVSATASPIQWKSGAKDIMTLLFVTFYKDFLMRRGDDCDQFANVEVLNPALTAVA